MTPQMQGLTEHARAYKMVTSRAKERSSNSLATIAGPPSITNSITLKKSPQQTKTYNTPYLFASCLILETAALANIRPTP